MSITVAYRFVISLHTAHKMYPFACLSRLVAPKLLPSILNYFCTSHGKFLINGKCCVTVRLVAGWHRINVSVEEKMDMAVEF